MTYVLRGAAAGARSDLAALALACFAISALPVRAETTAHNVPDRAVPTRETWLVLDGETIAVTGGDVVALQRPTAKSTATGRRSSSFVIAPGSELQIERDGDEVRILSAQLLHESATGGGADGDHGLRETWALTIDRATGSEIMLARDVEDPAKGTLQLAVNAVALDETNETLRIWLTRVDEDLAHLESRGGKNETRFSFDNVLIQARLQREDAVDAWHSDGLSDEQGGVAGGVSCPPEYNFTPGPIGPDITVFSLQTVDSYTSEFPASAPNGIAAFAVGTTSCNIGDTPASWYSGVDCSLEARRNRHPVIAGAMYRYSGGRFEQIGQSWVKHGFFAVNQNACGQCEQPIPEDPGAGYFLGVECSDPYSAQLNGFQSSLGPRTQINAFTGVFNYPPTLPPAQGTKIERRLQVHHEDLDPTAYPDAFWYVESCYVSADDAFSGNGHNNCAYRKVNMIRPDPTTTNPLCPLHKPPPLPQNNIVHYCAIPSQPTVRERPAIRAWKENDPSVEETDILTPEDPATTDAGLVILAVKTSSRPGGLWRYEYAMENVNSDRSIGSFRVTIPPGAIIENVGFHDVRYHSGNVVVENIDGADWEVTVTDDTLTWATIPFAVKQNANALRWGTLYNFRFDINAAPQETSATVGLFKPKPPLPDQLSVQTIGPAAGIIDCNNNGIADPCDVACGEHCGPNCGKSTDCDFNGVPDDCEDDCNNNDVADLCDIIFGPSDDCNLNEVPDECEPDCDHDGIPNVCETVLDTDGDGILDCDDECPATTTQPVNACICPDLDRCCLNGFCIPDYPRDDCLKLGGTPDCLLSPCRAGCLVGDADLDGDRDLADFAVLMTCFSGNSETTAFIQPSPLCRMRFDYNDLGTVPGDVDLGDYFRWEAEFRMGGPRVGP